MKSFWYFCSLWFGLVACFNAQADGLILTTEDAPPFNYVEDDGKTIAGSVTELIHVLFKRAQVPYTIGVYPWARAIQMASMTKDTCVYSTNRTPEREKNFVWIGPVGRDDWVLMARADSTIKLTTLADAKKYTIGGYRGDAVNLHLQGQSFLIDEALDDAQAAKKLVKGRTELWATGGLTGPYVAKKLNIKVKTVLNFKTSELYLACNPGTAPEFIDKLNTTLQAMVKDGSVAKIQKK
mgnify:CR=1 FL=1